MNNAGVQIEKTTQQTTDDDWEAVVGVNCKGVFNMCREALPAMEQGGGSIVNIGSISGNVAQSRPMAVYNASKSFVHGLTRSMRSTTDLPSGTCGQPRLDRGRKWPPTRSRWRRRSPAR